MQDLPFMFDMQLDFQSCPVQQLCLALPGLEMVP